MIQEIKTFLRNNNFKDEGIENHFNGLEFLAKRIDEKTGIEDGRCGIVKIEGASYYYCCVAPYTWCVGKDGVIDVRIAH